MIERRVYLGLGSNLDDRIEHIRRALDALDAGGVSVEAVSSVYDTSPWNVAEQPRYANAVAVTRTALGAHALLRLAKRIEADAGRDLHAPRGSARPLDIDILLIEGETVSAPDLRVPHERMAERGFVLLPFAEVAPSTVRQPDGRTVASLVAALPASERADIQVIAGPDWYAPTSRSHPPR